MDQHAERVGKLRSGKSCIEFRASKMVALNDLRQVARDILGDVANRLQRNDMVE